MRFFTSDLHLGHANIIRFCQRPFADTDHMNTQIIRNLQSTVTPQDELWSLGDLAMGNFDQTVKLIEQVDCALVLMLGNHDKAFPRNEKGERFMHRYTELRNVTEVHPGNTELSLGEVTFTVSHFPFKGLDAREEILKDGTVILDKFEAFRPLDNGQWLLCGHVHEKWRQRGRMINVGLDAWGGFPVSEDTLLDLVTQGPTDRDIIPWEGGSNA